MSALRRSHIRNVVLGSFAALCLGAAKCPGSARSAQLNNVARAPADSADQLLFGARVTLASEGVTRGDLRADSAYKYDEGTRFDLRGVTVTFLNNLGVKDGVLTARTGSYSLSQARLQFRHVQVLGTDGRRLQVEQLVYDLAKNQLSSDSAYQFTLVNPTRQQAGVAFTADPQLSKLTTQKDASSAKGAAVPPSRRPN